MPQTLREGKAGVRKVNAANGKVTLKHGPIENLRMSAMTMTFPVEDKASLAKVKEGDKVRATFDKVTSAATGRALSQSKSERLPRDGVQNSQQWCDLSDVAMEEALYDTPLYREFAGLGGALLRKSSLKVRGLWWS